MYDIPSGSEMPNQCGQNADNSFCLGELSKQKNGN